MIARIIKFLITHFTITACSRTQKVRESMLSTLFCSSEVELPLPDVHRKVTDAGRFSLLRAFLEFCSDLGRVPNYMYLQVAAACQDATNVALGFARLDVAWFVSEVGRGATVKEAEKGMRLSFDTWCALELALLNCCASENDGVLPLLHDRRYPHLAYKPACTLIDLIRDMRKAVGCGSPADEADVLPLMNRAKARRIRKALVEARRNMWGRDELREEALRCCQEWLAASSLAGEAGPVESELTMPDMKFDLDIPVVEIASVALWNGKVGKLREKVFDLEPASAARKVVEDSDYWRVAYATDTKGKEHRVEPRRELDMVEFVDPKSGHSLLSVYVGLDDLVISA